jgi:hypothetical protein
MKSTTKPTRKKRSPAKPLPLKIMSLAVTETEADLLASLCQAASDTLGRAISNSALARAVLRLAGHATIPLAAIVDEIESELKLGRKWGHDSTKPPEQVRLSRHAPAKKPRKRSAS